MAEITLGDYAGYIFLEMIKAREMADAYSRAVAERYGQDEVLRHFSVPRFKTPKMALTIPVLVSGARFRQTVRITVSEQDFVASIAQRAEEVRTEVELSRGGLPRPRPRDPRALASLGTSVEQLAREFHRQLLANPDPLRPEAVVSDMWRRVFRAALAEGRLLSYYLEHDPDLALLHRTTREVLADVRASTVVSKTEIESLLVNPETNVVKNGSSESSVFVVTAELLEEGFFLRTVADGETTSTIVEFD